MIAAASHASVPRALNPDVVGKVGHLHLEFARRDGRTILAQSSCTTPWHVMPPSYPDEYGYAYTLLVNPSGGLVGGDQLSVRAVLDDAAHVLMSTPSANRLYRSNGETARQHIQLLLKSHAVLEWLPEITIPYAGARFRQTIDVALGTGATVLLWDAMASGRVARRERWSFEEVHNEIRVATAGGTSVIERYTIKPGASEDGVGLAQAWDYVGSFIVVGDTLDSARVSLVAERLYELAHREAGDLLVGISSVSVPGMVVKLVAKTAPICAAFFDAAWALMRRELLGCERATLRRY